MFFIACEVSNCATCTVDAATCATCVPGRQLDAVANTCTAQCLSNCDDCSSSTDDVIDPDTTDIEITCDTCADGTTLVSLGTCYSKLD